LFDRGARVFDPKTRRKKASEGMKQLKQKRWKKTRVKKNKAVKRGGSLIVRGKHVRKKRKVNGEKKIQGEL